MILEPKMRLSLSDVGTKKVQFLLRVPSSSAKKVHSLVSQKSDTHTHISLSSLSSFLCSVRIFSEEEEEEEEGFEETTTTTTTRGVA